MNRTLIKIIKQVPVLKQVIVLTTVIGIFIYIYKKSDKRGSIRLNLRLC